MPMAAGRVDLFEPDDSDDPDGPEQLELKILKKRHTADMILKGWGLLAGAVEMQAVQDSDNVTREVMYHSQNAVYWMRRSIAASAPKYVFALTDVGGPRRSYDAIALVGTEGALSAGAGRKTTVMSIRALVVDPALVRRREAGEDLMFEIIKWGAARGHVIRISEPDALKRYYACLGFTSGPTLWSDVVSTRYDLDTAPELHDLLHMLK